MPFSHHSHSGQFCPGHAVDTLEQVVQTAIARGLRVFGLTEHMPRHDDDQYPEEREAGIDLAWHLRNEAAYVREALRLRDKYRAEIALPLGFECDWIRAGESRALIEQSIARHPYDYFVGSVHHVHTVPIDYDAAMYADARQRAGGTDERLFLDYFDAQLDMLRATRPPVVGHFDLIRLKSASPDGSFKQAIPAVWQRILRNLGFIASYGGILEINTAALRKGMKEPYPNHEICQAALAKGVRFCLSDDSHGVAQVAYGYTEALDFLQRCGIRSLYYLTHSEDGNNHNNHNSNSELVDSRFPGLLVSEVQVADLQLMSNKSNLANPGNERANE